MASEEKLNASTIRIGLDGGDHVTIKLMGWMHPRADDYWDGNWLISPIEVRVGGFYAEVGAGLRTDELIRFKEALDALSSSLQGEAVLESMEGWIQLSVTVERRGGLQVKGNVVDRPGGENTLRFSVDGLDVTYLPAVISALSIAEARFPVRGKLDA